MRDLATLLSKIIGDYSLYISEDYIPLKKKILGDEEHLSATMRWLVNSIKTGRGGSSGAYNLRSGKWLLPYPETTGYIITTLFDYYKWSNKYKYNLYAVNLVNWLCKVQLSNGACMSGGYTKRKNTKHSVVFNTGQNILGFVRAYKETGNERYLNSAMRAGKFLVGSTNQAGLFSKNLHHNIKHTYNSRTSWALLELYEVCNYELFREVAITNLNWVVKSQLDNGWYKNANFKPRELPNTHGIAYTIRGLVESYRITKEQSYIESAEKAASQLSRIYNARRFLPTFWDADWNGFNKFPGSTKFLKENKWKSTCLTGNVQLSIVWMKIYDFNENLKYLNSALKMIDYVKTYQNISTANQGVFGGIPGSFPIYGDYCNLSYPNWAAKFFADALMLKIKKEKALQTKITIPQKP